MTPSTKTETSHTGLYDQNSVHRSSAKEESTIDLARDEIFHVLSNERRRYALRYLEQHENRQVQFRELVDYITARENDVSVAEIDYKQRKRVYSSLRQTHLPTLQDYNLIEYDQDRGIVEFNGGTEEVQMYLEYVPKDDIPWCYHYLGLAGVLGVVLALTWAGVLWFDGLSGMVLASISVLAFGASAVGHTVYTKRNELAVEPESDPILERDPGVRR